MYIFGGNLPAVFTQELLQERPLFSQRIIWDHEMIVRKCKLQESVEKTKKTVHIQVYQLCQSLPSDLCMYIDTKLENIFFLPLLYYLSPSLRLCNKVSQVVISDNDASSLLCQVKQEPVRWQGTKHYQLLLQ